MPTATEMNANEIANTWKERSVRFSSGRYPPRAAESSVCSAPGARRSIHHFGTRLPS